MRIFFILAISLFWCGFLNAQEPIIKVYKPLEVQLEVQKVNGTIEDLEGLVWNRWTSKNFVVCSLSDTHAQFLHKHLEFVKEWSLARWGLADFEFSTQTKLICVDDPALFKKLFNIDSTKVEVRVDENGKIKETVIFMLADDKPSRVIPIPVSKLCLHEFAQKYDAKLKLWSYNGIPLLNASIEQIKEGVKSLKPILDKGEPMFYATGILSLTEEQYNSLTPEQIKVFENCSMSFCLMLRKEFGQDTFLKFLKATSEVSPEEAVRVVLKQEDLGQLDKNFKKYLLTLTEQIDKGKVPDDYFQIKELK